MRRVFSIFERWDIAVLPFVFLFFSTASSVLSRQSTYQELGFWVGGTTPMPGTELDNILDSNLGFGGFYRVGWPWIFQTEAGFSYANLASRATERAAIFPAYLALAYQIPYSGKLQTFIKLGGGYANIYVKPDSKRGWEPMGYAGLEFSLPASRHFRMGIRFDYNYIWESYKKAPSDNQITQLWQLQNGYFNSDAFNDPRYQQLERFRVIDGQMFHFGILMSFIL
jgi:hypothetical protein